MWAMERGKALKPKGFVPASYTVVLSCMRARACESDVLEGLSTTQEVRRRAPGLRRAC